MKGKDKAKELLDYYDFIDALQRENVRFNGIIEDLKSQQRNYQKAYDSNCARIQGFEDKIKKLEEAYGL